MTGVQNTERSVAGECVKCDGPFRSGQVPRQSDQAGRMEHTLEAECQDASNKLCGKCGMLKPRGDFYRNRSHADGLQSYCKACQNVQVATSNERRRTRLSTNGPQVPRPAPVLGAQAKQCRICNITKAPVAFRPNNNSGDGLATACRECQDSTATPAPPASNATL